MKQAQDFKTALLEQDEALRSLLEEAEAELRIVRGREKELVNIIADIRGRLGRESGDATGGETMTMHLAMAKVLSDHGGGPLKAGLIADALRETGLYVMRDGRPADTSQVHARVHNYSDLFTKGEKGISLKHTYDVQPWQTSGSTEGRSVVIRDRNTEEQAILRVGISYTVLGENSALDSVAQRRAWDLVARGFFEDGGIGETILTSTGWT